MISTREYYYLCGDPAADRLCTVHLSLSTRETTLPFYPTRALREFLQIHDSSTASARPSSRVSWDWSPVQSSYIGHHHPSSGLRLAGLGSRMSQQTRAMRWYKCVLIEGPLTSGHRSHDRSSLLGGADDRLVLPLGSVTLHAFLRCMADLLVSGS